jgi:hypothetical protein
LRYVHPQNLPRACRSGGIRLQADGIAIGCDPAFADDVINLPQGAAQVGVGAALIVIGPQQGSQRLTGVALPCDGQIRQQRDGLAAIGAYQPAVDFDVRRAE